MCVRFLTFAVVAWLTSPSACLGDVIPILSQGTALDPTESYILLSGGPPPSVAAGPTVPIPPVGGIWAPAPPGASWISFDQPLPTFTGGVSPPNGTSVRFVQPFFLPNGTNTGGITVWADDTAAVWVDGVLVFAANFTQFFCANGPIGCQVGEGGFINLSTLAAGEHTLFFDVFQVGGDGYGLLYAGSVESVPEPATFLLLGFGVIGALLRRRIGPRTQRNSA